ncbi:MAG: aminotransferase class V-fold PLP-dependent enzyme [Bryobacterales bacterium]|nr:aminotransferase class V-fold PLP-dependent enzyme [Bryobacterales bacterium]
MQRRQVLRQAALTTAASLFSVPARAGIADVPLLPDSSLLKSNPEKYWHKLRAEQFYLPDARVFLNNGSLGVAPRPVIKAVTDYLVNGAGLTVPEYEYPRWGYEMMDEHRKVVADFVGCRMEDLAFTHNATEALSTIAAGLDLKQGDEVVMTNLEHASGKAGYALKKARYGVDVREVELPVPPRSREQLVDLMISAIGPRTKVMFFSGIVSPTGLVMPIREICKAAREKGLITVVDGAHVNGQIAVRVDELGCDYFAGSPHKWMFAPPGCGILWGREEMLDRLWPSIVTGGWDDRKKHAARFMFVGTNNRAIFEGMMAGVRFANAIGKERIFERTHSLAKSVRKRALDIGIPLLTPEDERMYGALVTLDLSGLNLDKLMHECTKRKIWVLRGPRLRVSTNIHTRPEDLDLFFDVVKQVRG